MSGRTQAVYYRDSAGHEPVNPFRKQFTRCNPAAAARRRLVAEYVNGRDAAAPPSERPTSSQVDGELRELRVRFAKTRNRVLYRRSGLLVVLLHVFEKNTGRLPVRDRDLAIRRFAEVKARVGAEPRRSPPAAGREAPPR